MPPIDASDFYRWMWLCYAAGRADERGSGPLAMDEHDAAIVAIVRADWHVRMGETQIDRPAWLAALVDASEGMIHDDTTML